MALEKWFIEPGQTRTIDVEAVRSLKVGLIGGQIDVIAHDESGARVEVHSVSGKALKIAIDGDRLEIDHPQLRWDNFVDVFRSWREKASADVSVLVPRDVAVNLGVISASALVSGVDSDARLSTVSGEITVDGVTGDLQLNGVSGEISVSSHTGAVDSHTVTGDLTVQGELSSFRSDGVSGDVVVDTTGTPDRITVNNVSGAITLRLPAELGARYRITGIGSPVRLGERTLRTGPTRAVAESDGPADGRVVEVAVNTVSGAVTVLRGATAASASAMTEEARS